MGLGDVVLNQTVTPRLEPELKGRSVLIGVRVKFNGENTTLGCVALFDVEATL
jgi:hypothetical protein